MSLTGAGSASPATVAEYDRFTVPSLDLHRMDPRVVRPDDLAWLNRVAVQRDRQGLANIEAGQASDGDLEFQRRGSGDLDFDLGANFTVGDRRRDALSALFVVPP